MRRSPGYSDTHRRGGRTTARRGPWWTCKCYPPCNDDVDVSRIVEKCERPPAPPSNEECNFSRGRCVLHQIRGVRYYQTTETCKDRGGGRGFGWITRRTVRYRCNFDLMKSEQRSSLKSWGGEEEVRLFFMQRSNFSLETNVLWWGRRCDRENILFMLWYDYFLCLTRQSTTDDTSMWPVMYRYQFSVVI